MKNENKTREQLIDELEVMHQQREHLEMRQRQYEAALNESQQQLQQAQKMETLGTLVAGVAHEINNPINLIMYNIPILQKIWADFMPVLKERQQSEPNQKFGGFDFDFLADNLVQLIADMEMAAHRVAKTVSDLKNFSRQSNVVEKAPLQINRAVRNAMRLAQTTLRASEVEIDLQLGQDLPNIEGNLQSIEQIILNIIINAVQAIDHDQGKIEVITGIRNQDGKVYIRIRDNGRGISDSISDKIFLPFITDKHSQGGTGLGLSVSYSLVKAHEGEIVFDTAPGEGTVFTVYLPSALKGQAPKILVVDDDKNIRQMLIEALTMDHLYLVQEASNGIEASIKLGTYRPDLLILDIFMPKMDGLEVCRTIGNEAELADMKVIITTGYPDHPKLDEVVALGYTHIFSKPFDLISFMEAIDKILNEKI
ncbi:MAG: ATP-binding protein [Desulfobacterales bacterium]|jgi:signal transduction histidine kinase/ActR/RegA family two-component response regulator